MHFMECEWQRGLSRCHRVHWEGVGRRTTPGKLSNSNRHELHRPSQPLPRAGAARRTRSAASWNTQPHSPRKSARNARVRRGAAPGHGSTVHTIATCVEHMCEWITRLDPNSVFEKKNSLVISVKFNKSGTRAGVFTRSYRNRKTSEKPWAHVMSK